MIVDLWVFTATGSLEDQAQQDDEVETLFGDDAELVRDGKFRIPRLTAEAAMEAHETLTKMGIHAAIDADAYEDEESGEGAA